MTFDTDEYLDIANATANLGALVVFFSIAIVIGVGIMIHHTKSTSNLLSNLVTSLTDANAAMIPELARLNESHERSMEIMRQIALDVNRNEEGILLLKQQVCSLQSDLTRLERMLSENEDFETYSKGKFEQIDNDILNILNCITKHDSEENYSERK